MTGTTEPRGVTVATVLRDLAESRALDLELLAGAAGLDRRITIPHTQKTGLALSGFDAYLRAGRVLVFGESEVRYLETLTAEERGDALRRVFSHDAALPARHRRVRRRRRKPWPKPIAPACRCSVPARPRLKRCRGCPRCSTPIWPRAASSTAC